MRKWTTYGLAAVMTLVLLLGTGSWALSPAKVAKANPGTQFNAQYFNNKTLSGSPVVTRIDDHIDFNWSTGSPDPAVPADNFSARWTKTVNFPTAGKWTFRAGADDGIRVWIDATVIIDQWHDATTGFAVYESSIDQLTAGNHDLKVEYYEAAGFAGVQVTWTGPGGAGTGTAGGTTVGGAANWNAQYFNNQGLSGSPTITRTDPKIDFNWAGGSPDAAIPADFFSARWTATVSFPTPGHWKFRVGADDGIRVWIDVTQIVDQWQVAAAGYQTYEVDVYSLTAGNHDIKVEYFEATGLAGVQVTWFSADTGAAPAAGGGAAIPTIPPPPKVKAAVTADSLNVRTGPGRGYPSFTRIFYPDDFLVLGAVGDLSWIKIDLGDGTQGWVSNEWVYLYSTNQAANADADLDTYQDFVPTIPVIDIAVLPGPSGAVSPSPVLVRALTTADVKIRDGATLASKAIGSVPFNGSVLIEAVNPSGSWYLMTYQGIRGWISSGYVTVIEGRAQDLVISTEVVSAPATGGVFVPGGASGTPVTVRGRANTSLKLRDAASLRGTEIGTIAEGSEFVVEGRNTNGAWFLVNFNGTRGWVNSPYVTLIEGRVRNLPIR